MLVKIDNKDMSESAVLAWINRTRNATVDKKISPEFALEILSKTNFYGHIKLIVNSIEKLPVEERKKYKDFVLAAIDEREQKGDALKGLRALADVCGVRDEFETLNKKLKFYSRKDCCISYVTVHTRKEFEALDGKFLRVIFDNSNNYDFDVDLQHLDRCDLTGIKELKFAPDAMAYFDRAKKMPKIIDASQCLWVKVDDSDLIRVEDFKLGNCVDVAFCGCSNLPKNLDVSGCTNVEFTGCDLKRVKELKFKKGANVSLEGSYNLPKVLDFSECSKLNLEDCDFEGVKQVKFKNKAQYREIVDMVDNFKAKVIFAQGAKPKTNKGMDF